MHRERRRTAMKAIFPLLTILMISIPNGTSAFAGVTCELGCTVRYTEVLDSLPSGSSTDETADFRANCREFLGGSPAYFVDGHPNEECCIVPHMESSIVHGWGFDVAEARSDARARCAASAPQRSSVISSPS